MTATNAKRNNSARSVLLCVLLLAKTRNRAMIGRRWKTISFQESARSLVAISCRFWSSRWRGKSKNERSQPNRETEISDPDDSFAGPVSFLFDTHSSPRIRSCTPFTGLRWHAVPFFPPSVWYNASPLQQQRQSLLRSTLCFYGFSFGAIFLVFGNFLSC